MHFRTERSSSGIDPSDQGWEDGKSAGVSLKKEKMLR